MIRPIARLLALSVLLALPTAAYAQKEPAHTKETKSAEKFIALAITRPDAAAKRPFYLQALEPLRVATQKDPSNARVWLMAGSVQAALGQFAAADSAFDRALQLHPAYSDQINEERHIAWEGAFNTAVGLINEQKSDEGIRALEDAELIFDHRPEAKYYLGLFYMQREEIEKAEKALNDAIAATNGPVRAQLKPEAVAEWDQLATNARIKLSNIVSFRGAQLYDRDQFDSAAVAFRQARTISPASRDHLLNELQSMYARALEVDKEREKAKSPALNTRARELYSSILVLVDTLRTVDPNNEDIFFFSGRSHKMLSELTTDAAAKAKHITALSAINAAYEKLSFVVTQVQITESDSTATVAATIQNKKLKAGATGTLTFELLDYTGKVMGSAPVTFTIPAADAANATVPIKVEIPMTSPVAGWRYRIN